MNFEPGKKIIQIGKHLLPKPKAVWGNSHILMPNFTHWHVRKDKLSRICVRRRQCITAKIFQKNLNNKKKTVTSQVIIFPH